MKQNIPPGFERCCVCGEFNGTTRAKYLNWIPDPSHFGDVHFSAEQQARILELKRELEAERDPAEEITVRCLCQGTLCRKCGVNRVHRSGSNSYDEETNSIGHWPWFAGMMPCAECKDRQAVASAAPEPRPRQTPEEQQVLDVMVRLRGAEWVERHAELILAQARQVGEI